MLKDADAFIGIIVAAVLLLLIIIVLIIVIVVIFRKRSVTEWIDVNSSAETVDLMPI